MIATPPFHDPGQPTRPEPLPQPPHTGAASDSLTAPQAQPTDPTHQLPHPTWGPPHATPTGYPSGPQPPPHAGPDFQAAPPTHVAPQPLAAPTAPTHQLSGPAWGPPHAEPMGNPSGPQPPPHAGPDFQAAPPTHVAPQPLAAPTDPTHQLSGPAWGPPHAEPMGNPSGPQPPPHAGPDFQSVPQASASSSSASYGAYASPTPPYAPIPASAVHPPSDPGQVGSAGPGPALGSPYPPPPGGEQPASTGAPGRVVERAHPLTPVIKGWLILVAAASFFLRDFLPQNGTGKPLPDGRLDPWFFVTAIAVVALLAGFGGLVTWLTTRFVADENELTVRTGWLVKRSDRVAYSRIQSVDVVQPLAARLFGLAEVRIDVGGEGATKLQFLTRRRATELRDYLMRRAHGHRITVAESNATAGTDVFDDLGAQDRVLIRVPPTDLIVGALLSHELLLIVLGFFIPAALVFGVSWAFAAVFETSIPTAGFVFSVGLVIPMAMAVLSFVSRRVVGQFNYTLAETSTGLRITRGLTSLTSQSVPANRIQSISIAQPILWRLIGRYRLDIEVLGYGHQTSNEDKTGTSTVLLPIGTQAMVDSALQAVWPGLHLDQIQFHLTPARSRILDPLSYGWLAYGVDAQVIVSRTGWLTRLQSIVPHARLQSVRVTQGPWERRLDLANLEFHTTGLLRTHAIHHLDAEQARRLVFDEADLAMTARTAELESRSPDRSRSAAQ